MSAFGHSHPWAQRNGRQRGKERGCCFGTFRLHVRLSSGQRANGHECRMGRGRKGGKGEGEEERRLLKVGGKFGSAAKLTQLSSPLLKRNFGSPTPALPAWLPASAWLALHPLSSLLFLPCALPSPFLCLSLRLAPVLPTVLAILPSSYIHSYGAPRIGNVFWYYHFSANFRHDVSP